MQRIVVHVAPAAGRRGAAPRRERGARGSAAARDATLPWTLGVLNVDGSDAPNLLSRRWLLL
jgi:hypothetical protein